MIDEPRHSPRRQLRKRLYGRTRPGTLLKHHIPLKTDRWDVAVPGFTEIDLVAHCGSLGNGEADGAGRARRQALPFRLRGIDSDDGSEFINQHLWDYCQAQEIQCTRGPQLDA